MRISSQRILTRLMAKRSPMLTTVNMERAIQYRPGAILPLPESPVYFDIPANSMARESKDPRRLDKMRRMIPYLGRMGRDVQRSVASLDENPPTPKTHMGDAERLALEARARELGAGAIGYTDVPREAIFQGKAVLYDQAIVLTIEMDGPRIAAAPSPKTLGVVLETYYALGRVVNTLVDELRAQGYAAQGGHPLGGQALYPLLAERAGLGWHGRHGLIITPEFGARQRLAAIYTSIRNLPRRPVGTGEGESHEHAWIPDFCRGCGRCIRTCPGRAILETPIAKPMGLMSHTDVDRCFPEFDDNYGCSVCIKECAFTQRGYDAIKAAFVG